MLYALSLVLCFLGGWSLLALLAGEYTPGTFRGACIAFLMLAVGVGLGVWLAIS